MKNDTGNSRTGINFDLELDKVYEWRDDCRIKERGMPDRWQEVWKPFKVIDFKKSPPMVRLQFKDWSEKWFDLPLEGNVREREETR